MRPSTISFLLVGLAACATATPSNNVRGDDDDDGGGTVTQHDAPTIEPDAPNVEPDAADTHPDAAQTQPDAACTPTTIELLTNAAFDDEPMGTGWNETPVSDEYPLITDDDGLDPDTAPYRVWMGGIVSSSDSMYQSIQVPAGTTALELTGQWAVATSETSSAAHDTASLAFTSGGSTIETAMSLDNSDDSEAWTAFDYTVTNVSAMAGQTVRLAFQSSNNGTKETSFYFDSFSLTAHVCQ